MSVTSSSGLGGSSSSTSTGTKVAWGLGGAALALSLAGVALFAGRGRLAGSQARATAVSRCFRRAWTSGLTVSLLITAVLGFLAAPALARHNFSMLKVNPELGVAGAEVAVTGFSYPVTAKVSIRFNALDGPVLAELEPTANQDIGGSVRIPEGTASGRYVLFAVQYGADGKPNRIPGRGALTVVGSGGAPPTTTPVGLELEDRPRTLATTAGPGGGELVLVGLGAVGIAGLLTLGVARVAVSRRPAAHAGGEAS